MSYSTNPAGPRPNRPQPLPPEVYRRRRITVGIGLVLVLLLIWWLISAIAGLFKGGADDGAKPGQGSPTTPVVETTLEPRECTPAEVSLAVSLDSNKVKLGTPVAFEVTWTNLGEVACLMDGGWGHTNMHVVSGNDDIFNSNHCSDESVDLLLAPQETYNRSYVWEQVRSSSGCEASPAKIKRGGTYRITAQLGEVTSPELAFIVE